jgi:hypothetical protein
MLTTHEGNRDWPWYVVIAAEWAVRFLEAVGRSVERGHGAFGFMVPEDICSPGSSGGVHAMPASADTRSISWKAEFRED